MKFAQEPPSLAPWSQVLSDLTVLVTGSTGYIGSRLVPAFVASGAKVVRLLRPSSSEAPNDGTASVRGDPAQADVWNEALDHGITTIVHLAAQTSPRQAAQDPVADWRTNVLPVIRMLEACSRSGRCPTVLLAGTATAVGLTPSTPVSEAIPEQPMTVYDLHKLVNESYLGYYVRIGAVRGATLRLGNVYGPGPSSSHPDRGVLGRMIRRALEGKPITVYGDGTSIRDYVYLDDVIRAFAAVSSIPEATSKGEAFFVATGTGTRLREAFGAVAMAVEEQVGRKVTVEHVEPPQPLDPIETRDFVADPKRLLQRTGWRAEVQLLDGISKTVRALSSTADAGVNNKCR